jgi:hypothetical protein
VLLLSQNSKGIPLMHTGQPGQVDLFFMLKTIDDLKSKVDTLCDLKMHFQDFGSAVGKSDKVRE